MKLTSTNCCWYPSFDGDVIMPESSWTESLKLDYVIENSHRFAKKNYYIFWYTSNFYINILVSEELLFMVLVLYKSALWLLIYVMPGVNKVQRSAAR